MVFWDADGDRQYNPVKDLLLSGARLDLRLGGTAVDSVTTSSDGLYRFTGLDPDTYVLRAAAPQGFNLRITEIVLPVQANRVTAVNFGADLTATWTPTASATATSTPVTPSATPSPTATGTPTPRPTATPSPSATPDLFTVQGVVWLDADGDGQKGVGEAGLAGAQLEIVTDANGDGTISPADPVAAAVMSRADGSYVMPGIVRGAYVLREINPSGYRSTTPDEVIVPDQPARLFFVMDFGDSPAQNEQHVYLPILRR